MIESDLTRLVRQGIAAVEKGNTLVGLMHFEDAARLEPTPTVRSYLAFCLARERRQRQRALALCADALQQEPDNPVHYLNLGRVYLSTGQKQQAIQSWRKGLKLGRNPQIQAELKALGLRKPPIFASLGREHRLNKILGILFSKAGLR